MDALSDIAVFVEVVRRGSFTAAAERLEMSKSVVSKYVTRLEARLGARLLNRSTRRLSLTEAGEALYARSRRALEELEQAEAEVSSLQGEPRGELRLNCPMSFGILHVAPRLPALLERHPGLRVDLSLDDRRVDLIDAGVDLAIRIGELPDSSLVARRLGPCRHVICAAPDYLARHGTPTTPDALADHHSLSYRLHDSPEAWPLYDAAGKACDIAITPRLRMDNSLALREALLAGAGLALIPTFIVGPDLQAGRLRALLPDYRAMEYSIHAVYPQRRHLSPKIRAFVDFMAEQIAEPPDWEWPPA